MYGVKTENTKAIGSIIKCMGMARQNGQMGENIKEIMKTIKNMGKGPFIGRTEGNTQGDGRMVSSTARENTTCKMEIRKLENGFKARGLNGLIKIKKQQKNKIDLINLLLYNTSIDRLKTI